jgi:hypothetical protein
MSGLGLDDIKEGLHRAKIADHLLISRMCPVFIVGFRLSTARLTTRSSSGLC